MSRRYIVVSWVDPHRPDHRTREYGSASSRQAAIRLAERVLPAGAPYLVTTTNATVHHGKVEKTA